MPRARVLILCCLVLIPLGWLATRGARSAAKADKGAAGAAGDPVARGKYLVALAACGDCHTPFAMNKELGAPTPDRTRMLSGHPAGAPDPSPLPDAKVDALVIGVTMTSFRLPFGVVYAPNLTPDKETGIGNWTSEMFVKAMRTGRHAGAGRPILPPMPWMGLAQATDADLKGILAYLQSVPAVRNLVPEAKVPPPVVQQMEKALPKALELLESTPAGAPPTQAPRK